MDSCFPYFCQKFQDITSFHAILILKSGCFTVSCSRRELPRSLYAASGWTDGLDRGIPISRQNWRWGKSLGAKIGGGLGLRKPKETQWQRPCLVCHYTGRPGDQGANDRASSFLRTNPCYLYPAGRIWCHDIYASAKIHLSGCVKEVKSNGRVIIAGTRRVGKTSAIDKSENYARGQQNRQVCR